MYWPKIDTITIAIRSLQAKMTGTHAVWTQIPVLKLSSKVLKLTCIPQDMIQGHAVFVLSF